MMMKNRNWSILFPNKRTFLHRKTKIQHRFKQISKGRSREKFLLDRFFIKILLRRDNDLLVSEMK